MIADLVRGFAEAAVVRALGVRVPDGARIEALRLYSGGYWAIDWSLL